MRPGPCCKPGTEQCEQCSRAQARFRSMTRWEQLAMMSSSGLPYAVICSICDRAGVQRPTQAEVTRVDSGNG